MSHPFCTITASTRRNANMGGGRVGAAVIYLSNIAITPLWPVTAETIAELGLNSPREFKETYIVPDGDTLPDVREGDILVLSGSPFLLDNGQYLDNGLFLDDAGIEYPIASVAEWTDIRGGIPCVRIVCQQIKGT